MCFSPDEFSIDADGKEKCRCDQPLAYLNELILNLSNRFGVGVIINNRFNMGCLPKVGDGFVTIHEPIGNPTGGDDQHCNDAHCDFNKLHFLKLHTSNN